MAWSLQNAVNTMCSDTYIVLESTATPQGLIIPCTTEGLKLLGSPIGTPTFALAQFSNIGAKLEHDLSLLKSFPYWHQRTKLLTFSIDKLLNYFLRTSPPQTPTTLQLDASVDAFWAHILHFPGPTDPSPSPYHSQYEPSIRSDWVFVKVAWAVTIIHTSFM
jgi:hypothetical protein